MATIPTGGRKRRPRLPQSRVPLQLAVRSPRRRRVLSRRSPAADRMTELGGPSAEPAAACCRLWTALPQRHGCGFGATRQATHASEGVGPRGSTRLWRPHPSHSHATHPSPTHPALAHCRGLCRNRGRHREAPDATEHPTNHDRDGRNGSWEQGIEAGWERIGAQGGYVTQGLGMTSRRHAAGH